MTSAVRAPVYFDAFLAAIAAGARIDHVHLGHWDEPEAALGTHADFEAAQHCMAEKLLALGEVAPGSTVLDAGCGFGGFARLLDATVRPIRFVGLNIDPRQLNVARSLSASSPGHMSWIAADACALPFPDNSFDRLFCIEAMFHFASRQRFLLEAFRVLKPGGALVLSDILIEPPPQSGFPAARADIESILETDLGPWPEPWISLDDLRKAARACGFDIATEIDATRQTLPSYRVIAPSHAGERSGPAVMRRLHEQSYLTYIYLRLVKPLHQNESRSLV